MKVSITKMIKTSYGDIFSVGDEVIFSSKGKIYEAVIKKIKDKKFVITDVRMDSRPVGFDMIIAYEDIDEGSLQYPSED